MTPLSRRQALSGAATVGIGVPLVAACADDGDGTATAGDSPSETPSSSAASPSESPSRKPEKAAAPGLVVTADVPVGGGVVVTDEEVVVTQPTEGDFKAFSAICTHQGCLVGDVTDTINCPCHGSQFSIENGDPVAGPATAPLAAVDISVAGKSIELA